MRLQDTGGHDGTHEVFMNIASGGQAEQNDHDATTTTTTAPEPHDYADPLDDVFGSAPSSPVLQPDQDTSLDPGRREVRDPSDIPRLRSVHVTNGYREGLSASKEQHVQAGFDEGYSLGAELGMKVGWVMGVLEGVVRALPATSPAGREAGDAGVWREDVRAELARAEGEMSMKRLFGDEFFGGDGVWSYSVPGAEEQGEESVTFGEIAAAHPLVVKWERRARELAERLGLTLA